MAIKRIEWTVAEDCQSLSPAGVQDAGVQGEDRATVAVFNLPESLQAGYDLYLEYIDTYDGYDISDKLAVEDGAVAYALPLAWTQHGGRATLRLVAVVPGEEDEQEMVAYTLHAQISYHKRPGVWGRVKSVVQETVERLALLCQQWAAAAKASATKAEESETIAGTAAVTAGQAASGADASAKAAEQAAQTAADEAAAADSSRAGAATAASVAEQSMLEAANHKLAAESSEYNARLSMEAANASAFSAAQSEQAAAESAEKAETRVESVLERNDRVPLSFWVGTQAEYDALAEKPNNCFCIVTDDTTIPDVEERVAAMQAQAEAMQDQVEAMQDQVETLTLNEDRVTEKSVLSGWTYRLWDSGIAECWCTVALGIDSISAGGYAYNSFTFPITFYEAPTVHVDVIHDSTGPLSHHVQKVWTTRVYVCVNNSGTAAVSGVSLAIKAVGLWKAYSGGVG